MKIVQAIGIPQSQFSNMSAFLERKGELLTDAETCPQLGTNFLMAIGGEKEPPFKGNTI